MELADNDTYCNSYTYRLLITALNNKNIDTNLHTELPYISFTNCYMQWCTPTFIDVLKMGHHGSATGTSSELLEKLKPSYLISTNGDNLYNFPAVDVVDRVVEYDKANNTTLLDNLIQTTVVGNIIVYNRAKPQFQYIKNTSGYLYVEYYVVAIIFVSSACIIYFVPFDKISHAIRKKFFAKNIH